MSIPGIVRLIPGGRTLQSYPLPFNIRVIICVSEFASSSLKFTWIKKIKLRKNARIFKVLSTQNLSKLRKYPSFLFQKHNNVKLPKYQSNYLKFQKNPVFSISIGTKNVRNNKNCICVVSKDAKSTHNPCCLLIAHISYPTKRARFHSVPRIGRGRAALLISHSLSLLQPVREFAEWRERNHHIDLCDLPGREWGSVCSLFSSKERPKSREKRKK